MSGVPERVGCVKVDGVVMLLGSNTTTYESLFAQVEIYRKINPSSVIELVLWT